MIKNKLFIILIIACSSLVLFPNISSAASCLNKPAKVIRASNSKVELPRNETVLLTGTNVNVYATGGNRVCSTVGNIRLTFGSARINQANLGSGNDQVIIARPANKNLINLGSGNNQAVIKSKANTHSILSGAGNDKIIVANKSNNLKINAGAGNNKVILSSPATRQTVFTSGGDDFIHFKRSAGANKRLLRTGLGNDKVYMQAKGHLTAYLSEKQNPKQLDDTDTYYGGPSNDTVYDYHGGNDRNPNRIYGGAGTDRLTSQGSAQSDLFGGDGSDFIYAASAGASGDRIFGGRGNDKMFANKADRGQKVKGALIDGNAGDDWFYGSSADDTIIAFSGIKKIYGNGGDDMIVKTGNSLKIIDGGSGLDTISYVGHTPPGYRDYSGVMVNLNQNTGSKGRGNDKIINIEHLIGSSFDDLLTGKSGVKNQIDGGLGNDQINSDSEDLVDGGLGYNQCFGGQQINCNQESPGVPNQQQPIIDIGEEGVLTVIGSKEADKINVGYNRLAAAYIVETNRQAVLSRDCRATEINNRYQCPADYHMLTAVSLDGSQGNDNIIVDYSVPENVSTIISGGSGYDLVDGGKSKDFITNAENVNGRGGDDMLYHAPKARINGGSGSDVIFIHQICSGGIVIGGGGGLDGAVFAGAGQGVNANLKTGIVKPANSKLPCPSPVSLSKDIDSLEGGRYNDILTGHANKRTSFLGREGIDVFNARNNVRDSIITGSGGKKNIVRSDKKDRIVYGWGGAAF